MNFIQGLIESLLEIDVNDSLEKNNIGESHTDRQEVNLKTKDTVFSFMSAVGLTLCLVIGIYTIIEKPTYQSITNSLLNLLNGVQSPYNYVDTQNTLPVNGNLKYYAEYSLGIEVPDNMKSFDNRSSSYQLDVFSNIEYILTKPDGLISYMYIYVDRANLEGFFTSDYANKRLEMIESEERKQNLKYIERGTSTTSSGIVYYYDIVEYTGISGQERQKSVLFEHKNHVFEIVWKDLIDIFEASQKEFGKVINSITLTE